MRLKIHIAQIMHCELCIVNYALCIVHYALCIYHNPKIIL